MAKAETPIGLRDGLPYGVGTKGAEVHAKARDGSIMVSQLLPSQCLLPWDPSLFVCISLCIFLGPWEGGTGDVGVMALVLCLFMVLLTTAM